MSLSVNDVHVAETSDIFQAKCIGTILFKNVCITYASILKRTKELVCLVVIHVARRKGLSCEIPDVCVYLETFFFSKLRSVLYLFN